ncbi:MAG: hypothetical protein AAFO89_12465 [Planctomycetota bacterium]
MKTLAALSSIALASAAVAQPLTGSGPNLPIPSPNDPPPPQQPRAVTTGTGGWTGTWTVPAQPDWVGSFTATGPVPSGMTTIGSTRYDFTTLPTGQLPVNTFFRFGDVDGGSVTNEIFTLVAFDAGGAVITTPWLNEPISMTGAGPGGAPIAPNNTPGWDWDAGTGTYTIDGSTVTGGNPTISVFMQSNTPITTLSLDRGSTFANFSLAAPLIPAPASAALLGLGGLTACRRRR